MYAQDYSRDRRAAFLESHRKRLEASIGFDAEDDLEFNPSLTLEEANEIRREMFNSQKPPTPSTPISRTLAKAIPIINPANKMPITPEKSLQSLNRNNPSPHYSPSSVSTVSTSSWTLSNEAIWGHQSYSSK